MSDILDRVSEALLAVVPDGGFCNGTLDEECPCCMIHLALIRWEGDNQ